MAAIGNLNKSYVSSINFLDQREILNKVLDITNEESSFLDVMELTGRSVPTAVPEYHHFVNEELYVLGTASAVTGSGVTGSPATITATIDATAYAYVNPGELVLFPDGKVGYVSSKAGSNNIVIKSVDTSALTLTATQKISFFSNAAGEGSLSPAAKRWGVTKYSNQVQIFKGQFEITDVQKASKVEVDFQGKPFYMYKGQHESLMKFRNDIAAALIFGRKSAANFQSINAGEPTLVDAESKPVQTTMGLDQYVTSLGNNYSLLTSGTVALADVQALTQNLNKLRAPQEYFLFVGTAQNILWDNLLNNLGNSALLSQGARFQISGKQLELGIDTVKIYGRTYYKKFLPILDHKNIVNFTGGYNAKDAGYGVPAGKIKTNDGQMVDMFSVRYMTDNSGSDFKYREILLGGLAPVPTSERSVLQIHYESIQGLEILGSNWTFKLV